jgi:hypothetical protein
VKVINHPNLEMEEVNTATNVFFIICLTITAVRFINDDESKAPKEKFKMRLKK